MHICNSLKFSLLFKKKSISHNNKNVSNLLVGHFYLPPNIQRHLFKDISKLFRILFFNSIINVSISGYFSKTVTIQICVHISYPNHFTLKFIFENKEIISRTIFPLLKIIPLWCRDCFLNLETLVEIVFLFAYMKND